MHELRVEKERERDKSATLRRYNDFDRNSREIGEEKMCNGKMETVYTSNGTAMDKVYWIMG